MERDQERNRMRTFCVCTGSDECKQYSCWHNGVHEKQDSCEHEEGGVCSGTKCAPLDCLFVENEVPVV